MEKIRLGDICIKQSSKFAQKDLEKLEGGYPVYGASGLIKKINVYHQDKEYVAIVKDGAGIGRTMFLPAKSSVIGTLQYLIPKEDINAKYLYYAVKSRHLEKYFTGTTIPHIYFKDYQDERIVWHRKTEQKYIVSVLENIEKIIDIREQELQKMDELIKARFVEMFGDPVANPKRLIKKTLPELGEFGRGVSKHRPRNDETLLGGPYPLIQTGDVANSGLYITEHHSTYSELGLQQSKMWDEGTLCITIAANIAKTAILGFDACFPDSIVGFIANEDTNNVFVHYWFSFFQEILESQAPESAQKNINLKILSELKVIVPNIQEQNEFADFVVQVEKTKDTIQKSLDETQILFDSLMQKYFG